MAISTLVILVGVPTASVIFSGAKVITGNFEGLAIGGFDLGNITVGCWIIGTLAAVYVFAGGLKACAWADLIQGSALILGGVVLAGFAMMVLTRADPEDLIKTARNDEVTVESLEEAGAVERFWSLNQGDLPEGKVHMKRPKDDPLIPWTALIVGLWIPNFFYWGLNQYITQRTLGSKSLAEGQKGVVFAAFLKLLIPFIVVIPGMLAFNLFNGDLKKDAVNRNALILAENSPALYETLSEGMKPDPDEARLAGTIAKIDGFLTEKKDRETPQIYKFDDKFAELHPEDCVLIAAYNARLLGDLVNVDELVIDGAEDGETIKISELEIEGATVAQLGQYSTAIADAASEQLSKKQISVETLVAHDYDNAFPTLIRKLLPIGLGIKGFVLAAIFGAVVSSLASMLNSASTIASMDIYRQIRPASSQYELVTVGRICVVLFVLIAMIIAPFLGHPSFGGIFTFIQEFQGFISPGILAIFLFGLLVHRAPRHVGTVGLILNPILYGLLKYGTLLLPQIEWLKTMSEMTFLNRMAICFFAVIAVLTIMTLVNPLKKPVDLPVNEQMNMETSRGARAFGIIVVLLTVALYVVFW